ncbi:cutinase family protein [Nocardia inohanensis]|uniref:cutinase family protein n=1 Tax=Nocardia inohanensis TaxID=209246 RepID=UPI0009FEEC19|nr:cutinase family protein [Nocardia inohanensis]
MGDRKVLPTGKWRSTWVFATMLMIAAALIPLRPGTAHAQWCAEVDVVVARGTGEPGWLGDVVGNQLYGYLQDRLPRTTSAYSVSYPADYSFNLGWGSSDLVSHLTAQAAECPGQAFVLVGYSQGAAVIHAALGTGAVSWYPNRSQLPAYLADHVAAILLFGDPMEAIGWSVPGAYLGRTGSWCTSGDPICGSGSNYYAHVSYSDSFVAAANFAAYRI